MLISLALSFLPCDTSQDYLMLHPKLGLEASHGIEGEGEIEGELKRAIALASNFTREKLPPF